MPMMLRHFFGRNTPPNKWEGGVVKKLLLKFIVLTVFKRKICRLCLQKPSFV